MEGVAPAQACCTVGMPVLDLLRCFVPIKEQEVEPVLYSFTALFSILTSYFLLLPLREDAGISLGTSTLPLLFACSLAVTLLVTPAVTAYLNSKGHAAGRDAALRHFYQIMAAILLGFFVLYNFSTAEAWIDNLTHRHLPHDSSLRWTHPLDTVLQHRQQQQQLHSNPQQHHQQLQQQRHLQLQQQQQQEKQQRHKQQRRLASDIAEQPAGMFGSSQLSNAGFQPPQQQQQHQQQQTGDKPHLAEQLLQRKTGPERRRRLLLQAREGVSANAAQPAALQGSSSSSEDAASGSSSSSHGGASSSRRVVLQAQEGANANAAQLAAVQDSSSSSSSNEDAASVPLGSASSSSSQGGGASSSRRVVLQVQEGANANAAQLAAVQDSSSSNEDAASVPPGSSSSSSSSDGASSSSGSSGRSNGSSSPQAASFNGRAGDAALSKSQRRLRAAFYVWVNVMNLVGISSLWAKCADAFSPDAGARLFGFISAGATLGQLAGSLVAMVASWVAGSMLSRSLQTDGGGLSSSSSSAAAGAIRAAPLASSLLLVAAALQLVAAQLVTRIRPVRAVGSIGSTGPCLKPTDSSSGVGGDRACAPLIVRRSASGSSTAFVLKGGAEGSGAAGFSNLKPNPGAASTANVLPSKAQGQALHQGGTSTAFPDGTLSICQGFGAVSHTSGTASVPLLLKQPNGHHHGCDNAQQHAGQAGGGGTQEAGCGSSGSSGSGGSGKNGSGGSKSSSGNSGSTSNAKPTKAARNFQLHKVLTGFQLIWRSEYLLLVCSNLLLTYVVGSLMYFQRALVVSAAAAVHGPAFRTAFFAALNTWSAAAILLMQLFATSSLIRWLGMTKALALAPAICLAALLGIASCPLPWMVAVSEVARKVFGYAVLRPAREVLFTVVSGEEKYSAKLVIDTVIQRLGDALAAAVFQVLDVQYSLGQAGVGAAGCIMCIVWLATALALGRKHKQLATHGATLKT